LELLKKMRGDGASPPPRSSLSVILATVVAAIAVIGGLSYVTHELEVMLLLGTFGASSLLVFAYPDSPFCQPRNVILGHLIGAAVGLIFLQFCPVSWWCDALAVGTAIGLMKLTRTVHPPACSNPLIIFALKPSWTFLLFPTLVGAALIVIIALFYHNLRREARWPKYWL
jgi:CBS-domain-containing membrane protein